MRQLLAVMKAHDGAVEQTLYVSEDGYNSHPADTMGRVHFSGRLLVPPSVRMDAFSSGATFGESRLSYSEASFNNEDRGLNAWLEYGFDGRSMALYTVEDTEPFSTAQLLLNVTMEQPLWSGGLMRVAVRGKLWDTKLPIQSTLYQGNNALPAGVEGVAGDLRGKPKPLGWGKIPHAPATLVNSSANVWELVGNQLADITTLWDKGVILTKGAAYASLNDMLTGAAPAAGTWRYWLSATGSYIRLAGTPAGTPTWAGYEGATAADRTVAKIWKRMLLKGGVLIGSIDTASITANDLHNDAEAGLYIGTEPRNLGDALDEVAGTNRSLWSQTDDGKFFIQGFAVPAGTPAAEFPEYRVLELVKEPASDPGAGIPVHRVVVYYQKNNVVQAGDALAASVGNIHRGWVAQEYRSVPYENAAIKLKHLHSPTLELFTLLDTEAEALALATAEQGMRGVRRDRYNATVDAPRHAPPPVRVGSVIRLFFDDYGLETGKLFLVLGLERSFAESVLKMTIWG